MVSGPHSAVTRSRTLSQSPRTSSTAMYCVPVACGAPRCALRMNISATPSRSTRSQSASRPVRRNPSVPAYQASVRSRSPLCSIGVRASIRMPQPFITLMSSTAIVPVFRKKQTRMASPIAASAAATVSTNSVNTCPTRSPR